MPNVRDTLEYHAQMFELPMSVEQYHRLPALPDYRVEYAYDRALFAYLPRTRMARLRISDAMPSLDNDQVDNSGWFLQPLEFAAHREELIKIFCVAFANCGPLDTLPPEATEPAARAALRYTEQGGDGPIIAEASHVAIDASDRHVVGAAIVSRISLRPEEWPDHNLPAPLANLTWLFVHPLWHRRGIAAALLKQVTNRLLQTGDRWLVSHFQSGNAASLLFHWQNGFELLADPFRRRARGSVGQT